MAMTPVDRYYRHIVAQDLLLKLPLRHVQALPRPQALVVHSTTGNPQARLGTHVALALLTGQGVQVCRARRSLAHLRLRQQQWIASRVTLRGAALGTFLQLLVQVVLPGDRGLVPWSGLNLGMSSVLLFPQLQSLPRVGGCTLHFLARGSTPKAPSAGGGRPQEASLLWSAFQVPLVSPGRP